MVGPQCVFKFSLLITFNSRSPPAPVVHSQPEKKTKVAELIWGSETTDFLLRASQQILSPQAVQISSVTQSYPTLYDPMDCSTPGFITNSQSLLKLMSIEPVRPSNHFILCRPLLLMPSIFPSIRVFSKESTLRIRGPKYWSFSFNISPSNEHSGMISFGMDWSPCSAKDSQESFPTPQFTSISSLVLSFLYSHTQYSLFLYSLSLYSHIHTWLLEKP